MQHGFAGQVRLGGNRAHCSSVALQQRRAVRPSRNLTNVRCQAVSTETEQASPADTLLHNASSKAERFDGRAFRRGLGKTGRYIRNPINDKDSLALMETHGVGYSTTGLVAQMRESGNLWQFKDITVKLANAYGYCWGVERAVQMAYEARKAYPGQKLYVTNEIIHNPAVNQRLKEMDVEIIEDKTGTGKDFDPVQEGDVVILPAFGASVSEMRLLSDRKVQLVDTTCPWVSKVWNAVDNQSRKAHTSIIHGKYSHEETVATASFATTYLVVRDSAEAEYVADYIQNGGSKSEFLEKFQNSISAGFDPDTDLDRLGLANQTTMLRDETLQIGKLLEKTMMEKYGPAQLKDRYMVMDTICDATQTRQSAVYELTASQDQPDKKVDMMIVVGGFNSSNTSHLQEIPELRNVPSYWVNSAACIDVDSNKIMHKTAHGDMKETKNWIPDGRMVIGVTSGASTPDRAVEDVLDKVFQIRDPSYAGVPPRLEPAVPAKPEE